MPNDRFQSFGIVGGGIFFTIVGLANPFFPLLAAELGASTLAIGMMVTLKALFPIFIALPSGQLIDTIGPVRMLQIGSLSLFGSMLATVFATGLFLLALSQILLGAAIVIMASSLQVLVAKGEKTARNDSIKKYAMWMSAGGLIGPLVGGAIVSAFTSPLVGYRAAFIAASLATSVFMLGLLWVALVYQHPARDTGSPRVKDVLSPRGVFGSYRNGFDLTSHRAVQFGLTATFLIMYVQALYITFMPLYLAQNAYPTILISIVIAMKGFAGMLSRFVLTFLMRHAPLERILTTAGIVAAACVGLTPVAVETPALMIALAILMGASVGINMPVSIMIMVDVIGEEKRGSLMGLRLLTNRLAQIISPLMFGIIGQIFGLKLAFLSGGAMLFAVLGGFAFFARRKWNLSTWAGGPPREPAE